ncbi:hypothetical protein N7499_007035 [Penicillium canescens]|nr:hypothetical protein N7499_007035 [Penicillium canescens]KAJ6176042.1 hypothetical protein N7485_002956 [Penicillium canescens]
MTEAAMLSSIAHDDEYDVLLRNFANKIINGTADKKVVDPNMLRFFTNPSQSHSATGNFVSSER